MDATRAIWCGPARLTIRQATVIPHPVPFGVVEVVNKALQPVFPLMGRL
jgi:hypothetical protein